VKAGGFLAGRPEDIIEALNAVEKRYPGLDRVICATPLHVQLADLDRFAKEVTRPSAAPGPPPRRSRPERQPPGAPTGGTSHRLLVVSPATWPVGHPPLGRSTISRR
jgi:hypothetical protein